MQDTWKESVFYLREGKRNTRCCINVTKCAMSHTLLLCTTLLGLHTFTGCDSTSAFKGKGKLKAIKSLEKDESFQRTFAKLGDSWAVDDSVIDDIERFTFFVWEPMNDESQRP